MSNFVRYHNDGSVRMDWHTFRKMRVDQVMTTLHEHSVIRRARKPHPLAKGKGVKQYA